MTVRAMIGKGVDSVASLQVSSEFQIRNGKNMEKPISINSIEVKDIDISWICEMEQITYQDIGIINLFDERHIYSDEKGEVYIYRYTDVYICQLKYMYQRQKGIECFFFISRT